jgi:hypothetical protein
VEKANKVKETNVMEGSATVKVKSTFREYAEAIIMALVLALFIGLSSFKRSKFLPVR